MTLDNIVLSAVFIIAAVLFLLYTVYQIKRGRLLLRYSLLWMLLSVLILVLAIFPEPIFALGHIAGFDVSSNFIFSIAIFFLLLICITQSKAISQQTIKITRAIQKLAILEKEINDMNDPDPKIKR